MNPFAILFLLFIAIPLAEIYLLIEVGSVIGAPLTVFLVVFTAVLGAWLLRLQGFSTVRRIKQTVNEGGLPAVELLEGAFLLVAGALLLTPGFFTDAIGFFCLVPAFRRALIKHFMGKAFSQIFSSSSPQNKDATDQHRPHRQGTHIIEGEYKREDD